MAILQSLSNDVTGMMLLQALLKGPFVFTGVVCLSLVQTVQASIVIVVPSMQFVVSGAGMPRAGMSQNSVVRALERSRSWRRGYGDSGLFCLSGYGRYYKCGTLIKRDRQMNIPWHVMRATAYRTGRFER